MAGKMRAVCLALIGVLVLLVTLVLASAAVAARHYDRYLAGYWVGEAAFLEEAGLRSFRLFLAPRDDPRRSDRQGYLVIEDSEGGLLANGVLELTPPAGASVWWGALRAFSGRDDTLRLYGAAAEYDGEAPLPSDFTLAVSMQEGALTIYDHEKVYAFLRKDHATSAAAVAAYVA